ncbi:MAG: peptidyl-prolyl cis-trans isomerase [Faecalimonas sp.]|nr:peptidyl-prolyl cis-trans isomerase [Faecalimonas sp.]
MRGLTKKVVALTAVAAMALASLTGCAGSVENSEVVATVGDSKITAGVANFYIRNQQASIEGYYGSYLGDNMWKTEVEDGMTYEESVKDGAMKTLQDFYILRDHMKEFDVTITDDEKAAIEKAADAFIKANKKDVLAKISGEKEIVMEVLELMTISDKMYDAVVKDVNTEVSDDEAEQKAMQYVLYETSTTNSDGTTAEMSKDQVKAQKKAAEDFLAKAKENGSIEAYGKEASKEAQKATFDKDSTTLPEDVIKAADKLKEGEFAKVIETDAGYYVLQLTSMLDREATDAKKKDIVTERQNEEYQKVLEGWEDATEIEVDEKVWKKISLHKVKVTEKAKEQENATEGSTGAATSTDGLTVTEE